MSWNEPFEIVDQGELNHLGRKHRALGVDKLALEFLREQHRPEFLAHLFETLGVDPRTFPGPMILIRSTPTPCCQFS